MTELDRICALITNSEVPAYVCDGKCRLVSLNDSFSALTEFDGDEFLGKSIEDLLFGETTDLQEFERIKGRITEGTPFDFDLEMVKKSQDLFALGVFAIPFVDGSESTPYTLAIAREKSALGTPLLDKASKDFRALIGEALAIVQAS